MTTDSKEQHILRQIAEFPALQRMRIALTILRGIEPDYLIPPDSDERRPWETAEFMADLDRRAEELRSGKVEGISGDAFLDELRALRNR
mgnify:CR=1 FL=1